MWEYMLVKTIDELNDLSYAGAEFVCTRRHPDGYDEFLVRHFVTFEDNEDEQDSPND